MTAADAAHVPPRRRRAGEEESALARAIDFTRHYSEMRARTRDDPPGPAVEDDYAGHLVALAQAATANFCDWCVVTAGHPPGQYRFIRTRSRHAEGDGPPQSLPDELVARVPDLETLIERVAASGQRERVPSDVTAGLPWCVVIALPVYDEVVATVAFVRDATAAGFGPAELAAADQAAWSAATTLERADLLRRARQSTAATLRVAGQLRDLIDTSLALGAAIDVALIANELAPRARAIFDADEAVVLIDADQPLAVAAPRGEATRIIAGLEGPDDLVTTGPLQMPVERDGWLSAPIRGVRDQSLGRVAIRREATWASNEDREILALLCQAAASSLAAATLNATIRANEARWRVLVESAPIGLIEVASDEQIRWWNPAAAGIFAWPYFRDGVPAPTIPEDARAGLRTLWVEVAAGTLPSARTLTGVAIGNRVRDLTVSARLLSVTSTESTMLTLVDDVTDRRLMKEELRHAHTMEIRGQVAGSVVHDFNNLLTIIAGYAELLAADLSDGNARDAARAIVETSSRAAALTSELQTIGRTRLTEPVVLDPVSIIEANAEVLNRVLGEAVNFSWSGPSSPLHVLVDADQFEQVVLNLAINARDAMPTGGSLKIDVRSRHANDLDAAHHVAPGGDYVVITVTDSGVGMDDETRRRCFEPFFTTKGPFKGTGLGLSAARRFVEESHGSIVCRSERGMGSTFEIVLPLVDAPPEVGSAPAPAVPTPARPATIVVAEDDGAQRRLVTEVLARSGHRVIGVGSAEAAREAVEHAPSPVELLVSDVVMGVTAGDVVAAELQRAFTELRVLLVSGSATETVLDGLDRSRSDFLAKPFLPSDLVERVRALLTTQTPD